MPQTDPEICATIIESVFSTSLPLLLCARATICENSRACLSPLQPQGPRYLCPAPIQLSAISLIIQARFLRSSQFLLRSDSRFGGISAKPASNHAPDTPHTQQCARRLNLMKIKRQRIVPQNKLPE